MLCPAGRQRQRWLRDAVPAATQSQRCCTTRPGQRQQRVTDAAAATTGPPTTAAGQRGFPALCGDDVADGDRRLNAVVTVGREDYSLAGPLRLRVHSVAAVFPHSPFAVTTSIDWKAYANLPDPLIPAYLPVPSAIL